MVWARKPKPHSCALCQRKVYLGKRGTFVRPKDGKILYLCHTGELGQRDCYSEVSRSLDLKKKLQLLGE